MRGTRTTASDDADPDHARSLRLRAERAPAMTDVVIDLNADLAEGYGRWVLTDDEAMLGLVTSANIACGFHAGDPGIMRRVCDMAVERGVRIGAHVSYRDLAGFGRRTMDVPA